MGHHVFTPLLAASDKCSQCGQGPDASIHKAAVVSHVGAQPCGTCGHHASSHRFVEGCQIEGCRCEMWLSRRAAQLNRMCENCDHPAAEHSFAGDCKVDDCVCSGMSFFKPMIAHPSRYYCEACVESSHKKCERYADQYDGKLACQCSDDEHAIQESFDTMNTTDGSKDFNIDEDVRKTVIELAEKYRLTYMQGITIEALLKGDGVQAHVLTRHFL